MKQPAGAALVGLGLIASLCVALGGCNGANEPGSMSLEQSVPNPSAGMQALASPKAMTKLAPATAVASLPEDAGGVLSVRGRSYANGFRQDILLEGGAVRGIENGITILARTSPQATLDEATPLSKPTEASIRSELGRTFPHIAMQVVDRPSSNTYGPYGLALGRAKGTIHCVYAWQWIEESSVIRDTGLTGPVALRVRLCRPDTTFDTLAALMNGLTINRYTPAEISVGAVVEPPSPAEQPRKAARKRVAARAPQRMRSAGIQRDATSLPEPAAVAAPVAPQPLATDLPPQAYLGPKASATSKPTR